jgi:hypothetical protein
MSEHDWTAVPVPPMPTPAEFRHTAVVDGLSILVEEKNGQNAHWTSWKVDGWLADIEVWGANYHGLDKTVDQAKAEAVAAAHRMHAAGVRGTKEEALALDSDQGALAREEARREAEASEGEE